MKCMIDWQRFFELHPHDADSHVQGDMQIDARYAIEYVQRDLPQMHKLKAVMRILYGRSSSGADGHAQSFQPSDRLWQQLLSSDLGRPVRYAAETEQSDLKRS